MKKNIIKYLFMGLSILICCSFISCNDKKDEEVKVSSFKESSIDDKSVDEYKPGFYTGKCYVNKSADIMFTRLKGFKFSKTDNIVDDTFIKNKENTKESINIEAFCKGTGTNILFMECNLGKKATIDEATSDFLSGIETIGDTDTSLEDLQNQKRENVIIADKEYRMVEISANKQDANIVLTCYLRIVGNHLFVIEVADVVKVSNLKNGVEDVIKAIRPLKVTDNIAVLKIESARYQKALDAQDKKAASDPSVQKKNVDYAPGVKKDDEYINNYAGFMFKLPKYAIFTSINTKAEMEATSKDMLCSTYVTSEFIGNNYNMAEYINTVADVYKNMNYKVLDKSKTEKMIGKTWRVISLDTLKKTADKKKILQKSYIRIVGDNAIIINFQYIKGNEKLLNNMKKAYLPVNNVKTTKKAKKN